MWMTRALVTAHGLAKPTSVLPECSSLPTDTKENHCGLFSGKFRQVSGAKKRIITGTNQLKMTALTIRNTGAPKQSTHQQASCSSQEYSRALLIVWTPSLTLHLKVSEWDSITFHWAQLPKGPASCLPSISFPLRSSCTHGRCSGNNAFRGGHNTASTRRPGASVGSFQEVQGPDFCSNTPRDGLYPTQLRQIHPYSYSLAEHRKVPVKLPEITRKDCTFQLSFILYWQHWQLKCCSCSGHHMFFQHRSGAPILALAPRNLLTEV